MDISDYYHEISKYWPKPGRCSTREIVDLCIQAVTEHPDSSALWCDLGIIMHRCDETYGYGPEDYLRCFENSIKCDPNNGDAYQEFAYILDVYFSDYDRAAKAFKNAIDLGAKQESYYGYARALAQAGRTEKAIDSISENVCPFHNHPDIQKLRTEILDGDWFREGCAGPSAS